MNTNMMPTAVPWQSAGSQTDPWASSAKGAFTWSIPVSDALARDLAVSGGKGANCHVLLRLSEEMSDFRVPRTSVVPTAVFEAVVLADKTIQDFVRAMGEPGFLPPPGDERIRFVRPLQLAIEALELPAALVRQLGEEFARLGGDVAVRSSATCEDGRLHAAPGQGYSALHQTTLEGVASSLKRVWASLYSAEFIGYREGIGYPHPRARMAVLLQSFVLPSAAGVVYSFDQATGRPGYWISALPGTGEGVAHLSAAEGNTHLMRAVPCGPDAASAINLVHFASGERLVLDRRTTLPYV